MAPAAQAYEILFGPFALIASERRLTKNGVPIELGSRALDILVALVSRPNEVISKNELLSQVWPEVTVEENSLRFHMANLRRALGDGKEGARYITTLAGRGYCFVAPFSPGGRSNEARAIPANFRHANLPPRLSRMVGRADDILRLSNSLGAERFVTIAGAGGIGKTTAAVAVGHDQIEGFGGAVHFVDLGMVSDPKLVAPAVASLLGISVQSQDATANLVAHLRDKRLLLILDTCEHLIEAVAVLASRIFMVAPQVHILVTSREPLQVEGEYIYRLDPLACPPHNEEITAEVARTFPANELFIERAVASGARQQFSDAEITIVSDICRKLDGVALAIELAAKRVDSYGLEQIASLLDQHVTLRWRGQRIAPQRQKTLQATLDWSFGLLSELEQLVLRRLGVFVGHFSLDAALAVVTGPTVDRASVFDSIDGLIAKSMIATRPTGAMMRYRLLDTTRSYLLEFRDDPVDRTEAALRHAKYFQQWLEQIGTEWRSSLTATERTFHFAGLNNVRSALEWCFGLHGNTEVGIGLVCAAAPVFLAMSLLPECHDWSERGILVLDEAARGGREEMHLQATLGVSLMFMRGGHDAARAALNKSLAIAEELGDALGQLRLLGPLAMFHGRIGEFKTALHYAKRCSVIAGTVEDSTLAAPAHSILGVSLHLCGELSCAREELEAAVGLGPRPERTTTMLLGVDARILAGGALARTLWLQGHPDQAVERARRTIAEAVEMDHSLMLCIGLMVGTTVSLWTGDLESAEEHIAHLTSRSESHSMPPFVSIGRGFKAVLAIRRGDAMGGVETLRRCLDELHSMPYEVLTTVLNIALVQGLAAVGQFAEGLGLIEETIQLVEANGDLCYMPEVLRVKAGLLLSMPTPGSAEAEACFMHSLELSRRQGARSWELRTATDWARSLASQGRVQDAHALLKPIFAQFTEGLETADLKDARSLLATWPNSA